MGYAIGLMSGTSLDGVDVALVRYNENDIYELIDFFTVEFPKQLKNNIVDCIDVETSNVAKICSLNIELGYFFGEVANKMKKKHEKNGVKIDFIASHGQTLYHQPVSEECLMASTLQVGESSMIAEITSETVVSDFRYRDMSVGGQGAPIVPYSEFIMYKSNHKQRILQNIGGISNATIIPKNATIHELRAFDTGPGNMIIDELTRHFYQQEYDNRGSYAKNGKVSDKLLDTMMSHPFFSRPIPRTTGREDFGKQYVLELLSQYDLPSNDWIRTATFFTAKSIAESLKDYVTEESELIVGGGGSYNPVLIEMLKQVMPSTVRVMTQEDINLSSEAKEAIAMVVLGYQTLRRKTSNVPSATGATKEVILGKITYSK